MTFMLELLGFVLGAVALFAFNFWNCLREYDRMAQKSERRRRERRKATERAPAADGARLPFATDSLHRQGRERLQGAPGRVRIPSDRSRRERVLTDAGKDRAGLSGVEDDGNGTLADRRNRHRIGISDEADTHRG